MGRRLILDTNILIAYERGTMDRSSLDDDELAIASVSVAEYYVGHRDGGHGRPGCRTREGAGGDNYPPSRSLTTRRRPRLTTGACSPMSAASSSPRSAHDLIIAAHAAQTGRTILSRDAKARFGELPGVSAIDA